MTPEEIMLELQKEYNSPEDGFFYSLNNKIEIKKLGSVENCFENLSNENEKNLLIDMQLRFLYFLFRYNFGPREDFNSWIHLAKLDKKTSSMMSNFDYVINGRFNELLNKFACAQAERNSQNSILQKEIKNKFLN